jgi:hexosaminidase
MNAVSLNLEFLGLTHRSARMHMLHRMAGTADITALRVLADVVEPVKDYNRWDDAKGPIDFHAPLNRLIDAAYPESDTARFFSNLVQSYVSSGHKDQDAEKQIRMWLVLWSNNDSHLHALLETSSLLQEDEAQSANLSAVASAGLQALDYLDKSQPAPDSWKTQQLALIEQAKKPSADVLLMIVAPVQQLVEAGAGQYN